MTLTPPDALWGGITAGLAPSIVALFPVYAAFLIGSLQDEEDAKLSLMSRDAMVNGFFFSIGFLALFVLMGTFSDLLPTGALYMHVIAGVVLLIWGLKMLGGYRFAGKPKRDGEDDWPASALVGLVIGAALTIGWAPTSGPVLGNLYMLTLTPETMGQGAHLLAWYAVGLGLVLMATSLVLSPIASLMRSTQVTRRFAEIVCGAVLIAASMALASGSMPETIEAVARSLPQLQNMG